MSDTDIFGVNDGELGFSLADSFGFIGWTLNKAWHAMILMLPWSPLYYYLDNNLFMQFACFAAMIVPYIAMRLFIDWLSSYKHLFLVACASCLCLAFAAVLETLTEFVLIEVCLLSFAMWGMSMCWRTYYVSHGPNITKLRGASGLISAVVFLYFSLAQSQSINRIAIFVLPAVSFVLLFAYFSNRPIDCTFSLKETSKQRISGPYWSWSNSLCSGIGISCIFAAAMPAGSDYFCLSIMTLIGGFTLLLFGNRLLSLDRSQVLIFGFVLVFPALSLIPHVRGGVLAAMGVICLIYGRSFLGINRPNDMSYVMANSEVDFYNVSLSNAVKSIAMFVGFSGAQFASMIGIFQIEIAFYSVCIFALAIYIFNRLRKEIVRLERCAKEPIGYDEEVVVFDFDAIAEKYALSARERQVIRPLAYGHNAKRISQELYISENTAKTHIYNIYKKMHVHSQQELIELVEKQNSVKDG